MKFFLLLLASVFIALAWLLPIHYRPWVTYTGELFAFLSLFALGALYLKDKIKLPMMSLPLLFLAGVPLLQYFCGELFFFDKARDHIHPDICIMDRPQQVLQFF